MRNYLLLVKIHMDLYSYPDNDIDFKPTLQLLQRVFFKNNLMFNCVLYKYILYVLYLFLRLMHTMK